MSLEELLTNQPLVQFTFAVTHDGIHWFDTGWYGSPKLCLAADKKRPFPKDWSTFKNVKLLKRTYTQTTIEEDSSTYGIKFV
ncbi:MAG: hypothetical protein WC979_01060 [Candidatus Pacearchaeota archaeon]|jgi:hypothetical protein|nr:hypothetical protein [Clostridia bacterium]